MKELRLETWKSSLNQEERHYFRAGKGKGYQKHQYVFGYNPQVITMRKIEDGLWELELKPL